MLAWIRTWLLAAKLLAVLTWRLIVCLVTGR